jgi:hypothetical protein
MDITVGMNLPLDIVKHILSYDRRFIIRDGNILQINQIQQNDPRRTLLQKIQKPNISSFFSTVVLSINPTRICVLYKYDRYYVQFLGNGNNEEFVAEI